MLLPLCNKLRSYPPPKEKAYKFMSVSMPFVQIAWNPHSFPPAQGHGRPDIITQKPRSVDAPRFSAYAPHLALAPCTLARCADIANIAHPTRYHQIDLPEKTHGEHREFFPNLMVVCWPTQKTAQPTRYHQNGPNLMVVC